jgi:hypothetical protein
MRSISEQGVEELGGPVSVLVRQKKDHVELDRLLHELEATPAAEQRPVLRRLYRLVFPHAFAEEAVLWPLMRRLLPDGHELTLQVEQEHQEVNELVTLLEELGADAPARPAVLERLVEVLREDVRDEEDELLPRLQEAASRRGLVAAGVAWEVVRRVSPTRAHPVVSRRPPGQTLAAVPLTVIDRLRDATDAALDRGVLPQVAGPTGRALRTAAHRVERFPPLTRGEDPSTHRG